VSVQDELRHHAFKPGDIWFLATNAFKPGNIWFLATNGVSPRVRKYQNVLPIWEIVDGTAEDFQEVFGDQWLGKVGKANCPPFHLFKKRDIGKVWFVTVKKTSKFSEYGSDANMPSGDANNLAFREKFPVAFKRLQRDIDYTIKLNFAVQSELAQLVKKAASDVIATSLKQVETPQSAPSPVAKSTNIFILQPVALLLLL
jgi:hypothetical protein